MEEKWIKENWTSIRIAIKMEQQNDTSTNSVFIIQNFYYLFIENWDVL